MAPPLQITPTVEHQGMNIYIQNISDNGYVYIGTDHQYSKLTLENFGHRLGPNESIKNYNSNSNRSFIFNNARR